MKHTGNAYVALGVTLDFSNPEIPVPFESRFLCLPIAAMPEFAIDKNGKLVFPDAEIGTPGYIFRVLAITDSGTPQKPSHGELGFCSRAFVGLHAPTALFRREYVHRIVRILK